MPKTYQNDQKIRRSFILYEFEKEKPIFESFKNLCETMGNKFMKYQEFEFWFQRFSSGNFDLDYDTSQEPKNRTLTDLPVHVFEKIADNLRHEHRLTLRNVCQSLRQLVDSWDPKCARIEILKDYTSIRLNLDGAKFLYKNKGGLVSVQRSPPFGEYRVRGRKQDVAMRHLAPILKHPKLHVERFEFNLEQSKAFIRDLERHLEKLNSKIKAKRFALTADNLVDYIGILRYLEPRVLKTVDLKRPRTIQSVNNLELWTVRLNESEACQHAEQVLIHNSITLRDYEFTIPRLLTLPRVTLSYTFLPTLKAVEIFKHLLKSATLQLYEIKTANWEDLNVTTLQQMLIEIGANVVDPENRPNVLIYRNPQSVIDEHFEIQLRGDGWSIERKRN